jgi:hypothetical protein
MGMIFAVAKHLCSMLRHAAVSATAMSRHRQMIQPSELLRMSARQLARSKVAGLAMRGVVRADVSAIPYMEELTHEPGRPLRNALP